MICSCGDRATPASTVDHLLHLLHHSSLEFIWTIHPPTGICTRGYSLFFSHSTSLPKNKQTNKLKLEAFVAFFLFLPSTLLSVSARLPHPAGVDDGFTTAHARAMAGVHAGWKGDSVDTSTRDISTICRRSSGWRGARDQTATAAAKSLFCTRRVRGL